MTFALLIFAATLDFNAWLTNGCTTATNGVSRRELRAQYYEYLGDTNRAERVRNPKKRRQPDPRPKDPIAAWHKFARGGKVKFQEDLRPEPFDKVKPDPRDKKPRQYKKEKK